MSGLFPMVEIGEVIPGSANEGILKPGDLVYAFDGVTAPRMRAFRDIVKQHGAGDVSMTVIRDGQRLDLTARIVDEGFFKSIAKLNVFLNYAWDAHRLAQPMDAIAMAGPAGNPCDHCKRRLLILALRQARRSACPGTMISRHGVSLWDCYSIRHRARR